MVVKYVECHFEKKNEKKKHLFYIFFVPRQSHKTQPNVIGNAHDTEQ